MDQDISFCGIDCNRKCRRNKKNIRDHSIPHSFFVERPPDCPYRKKQDNFYHITEKSETLPERRRIVTGSLEKRIGVADANGEYQLLITVDVLKVILSVLKEQEERIATLESLRKIEREGR